MRLAITAFIAGGSLLFFLPQVPSYWLQISTATSAISLIFIFVGPKHFLIKKLGFVGLLFILGFSWNAQYAENRLENILRSDLEGKEIVIEGRVIALPQSNASGAKFAFEIERATFSKEIISVFPRRVYLSWQPAWRSPQAIPEVVPWQRWKFKVKLKQPYGSLNPHTFDFERWAFHQDYGASGSVRSGELMLDRDLGLIEFELRMELARYHLRKKIHSMLPADARYGGVLVALVMGDQNAIDQDDWQIFNATGIGHLISIGCNIYLSL